MKSSIFFKLLVGVVLVVAVMPEAQAARRRMFFAAVAQSTLPRDSAGAGKVYLTCNVHVRNTSATSTQTITDVQIRFKTSVPTTNMTQPEYVNQVGSTGPGFATPTTIRHYAMATHGVGGVGAGVNLTLPVSVGVYSSVTSLNLFRASTSFQYNPTATFDTAGSVPTHLIAMHHCHGWITVEDAVATSPGAVVAVGSLESIAENYTAPPITYGLATAATVTGTNAGTNSDVLDRQLGGPVRSAAGLERDGMFGMDTQAGWTEDCDGDGNKDWGTATDAWDGNAENDPISYGGDATPTTSAPFTANGTNTITNAPVPATATANTYTTFPQHIVSVPFLINGGKPF